LRSACPTRHRRGSAILSGRSSSNHAMTPNFPGIKAKFVEFLF
jgi:hypothetical protein